MNSRPLILICVFPLFLCSLVRSEPEIVQVYEDFSKDPGWEGVHNRVVVVDAPLVQQDFGWGPTAHASKTPGELGGRLHSSLVPAWYAMPINKPLTFDDKISASGKIAITKIDHRGVAYFGFFNSQRLTWRPWSSMALRFSEEGSKAQMMFDYMTADWQAGGIETDIMVPADGSVHTWSFSYDPDAVIDARWTDEKLKGYLTDNLQTDEEIYEKAVAAEPGLTREQLSARLNKAFEQSLIRLFHRNNSNKWWLRSEPENCKGLFVFQLDDLPPYKEFMSMSFRRAPLAMDRFGIFNRQIYGNFIDFYLADVVVNGHRLDLSQDPAWEARGNRGTAHPATTQSAHSFGYSQTNWAGRQPGEIGGLFWRVEPHDPMNGYYADDIGQVTLDDPISFSGNIAFPSGDSDSAMWFGYFNAKEQTAELPKDSTGFPMHHSMGIALYDSSAVGYYLLAFCSPKQELASRSAGPVFIPTGDRHTFRFDYDPKAAEGIGRIVMKIDEQAFTLDLHPNQRQAGAKFDRFGLVTYRSGGHHVTLYLDDLIYTACRDKNTPRRQFKQVVTTMPHYQNGGRQY